MKTVAKKFLVVTVSVLFIFSAHAENLVNRAGPRIMSGARPVAMGNAFAAVKGSDANAMFYNPAAINDYEDKLHFNFLLPKVEFSYKAIPFFVSEIPDLADDIDAATTDSAKIDAFDTFAAANTGRYEEVGMSGNLAIMMHKRITIAAFYDTQGVMALLNPASSTVDIEAVTHGGIMAGTAYSFFDDQLQAGVAVKFIGRHLIDETITQRDIITNNDFDDAFDYDSIGYGIGADIGLKGAPNLSNATWEKLDPKFAITLQDVGHTRFNWGDDVGKLRESLTVGSSIAPKVGPFDVITALDFRDLDSRGDFLTKLHAGTEWTLPDISKILRSASLRLGLNQIYFAGGLGLNFKYFNIDLATYGREIASDTIEKQSRMFTAQLSAGF